MRRLHHRIYLSLLAVSLLAVVLTALASHLFLGRPVRSPFVERLVAEAGLVAEDLPHGNELRRSLKRHSEILGLDMVVRSATGSLLASSGRALPAPDSPLTEPRPYFTFHGTQVAAPVPDGRTLVVRARHLVPGHLPFLVLLGMLFVGLALGSLPVSLWITRRLETLREAVKDLGSGNLSTRVEIHGVDEVASLSTSFNWAASRIEQLVDSQRRVLASASHELRSPLARLRLALELLGEGADDSGKIRVAEAVADINELNELVEDLLIASRIEAGGQSTLAETIDISALLIQEAPGVDACSADEPVEIIGDSRLIRRLLRNLFENAKRHGGGIEIVAGVEPLDSEEGGARLWVADRGPGVPPEERERIFEPYYRAPGHREGQQGGVGFGLALVRQIARYHGGSATCRAREGGGTLFEVVLARTAKPE